MNGSNTIYEDTLRALTAGENLSPNDLLCRWRDERDMFLRDIKRLLKMLTVALNMADKVLTHFLQKQKRK